MMDPNKRGNPPFESSSYAAGLERRVKRHEEWAKRAVEAAQLLLDGYEYQKSFGEQWWRDQLDQPQVIMIDANDLQNRDSAVRNTQQTSDMVERVAGILRKSRELNMSWNDATRLARVVLEVIPLRITEGKNPWGKGTAYGDAWEMGHSAALEASHHAELVERVARLRRFIETRKRLASPSAADEQRLIADLEAIITHHAELVEALRQTTEIIVVRYNADSAPTLERVERENRELLTKIGGAS